MEEGGEEKQREGERSCGDHLRRFWACGGRRNGGEDVASWGG